MNVRENDLSIVILNELEFPKHKYWEFREVEKKAYTGNIHQSMIKRLKDLYQAFTDLFNHAQQANIFLVEFKIIIPNPTLLPKEIVQFYFEFIKECKDIEYMNGNELKDKLDMILEKLADILMVYKHLFPRLFPISE